MVANDVQSVSSHLPSLGGVGASDMIDIRGVVSGGAGGALASSEFGSSVNPITTRGGRLCPLHYC